MSRTARIDRETSESKIHVELDLDGTGKNQISTGVGFYDHMLTAFSRHALFDLVLHARGDTLIDSHHTVEDLAIVLGDGIRESQIGRAYIGTPVTNAHLVCCLLLDKTNIK